MRKGNLEEGKGGREWTREKGMREWWKGREEMEVEKGMGDEGGE